MNQTPFIDVHNARAYVSRRRGTDASWTHEPCANWQQLEPLAIAAIEAAGGGVNLSAIYACPPDLAALALWADDLLGMVVTVSEISARYGISGTAVKAAAEKGRVLGRKSGGTWLIFEPDAAREWGDRDDR